MHILQINKSFTSKTCEKMYVAAIAKSENISLPNRIKLITNDREIIFNVTSYKIDGIKEENPATLITG